MGTYPEMSSHATYQGTLGHNQLAEPLWTDPGLKGGISVRELISNKKSFKKVQAGNKLSNIPSKSSHVKKKPPPLLNLLA